jgi:hypothetical protein
VFLVSHIFQNLILFLTQPWIQRRAVMDAATIAGLNVLRIMNETAATALCWGLPKSLEFPEDSAPAKNALFFDMGHSCTQARPTLQLLFEVML